MHLTTVSLLPTILALLPLTLALPAPSPSTPTAQFHLKSRLLPGPHTGAHNKRFNNLYVTPYHTGAGTNDASMSKKVPENAPAFLNGTSVQFAFEGVDPMFPSAMICGVETEYTSWQPITINTGYGPDPTYSTFSIDSSNLLQFTTSPSDPSLNEFHGWRICDWWHDVPQLFWKGPDAGATLPSSCADVELCVEYI